MAHVPKITNSNSNSNSNTTTTCLDFTQGSCDRGDDCRFLHAPDAEQPHGESKGGKGEGNKSNCRTISTNTCKLRSPWRINLIRTFVCGPSDPSSSLRVLDENLTETIIRKHLIRALLDELEDDWTCALIDAAQSGEIWQLNLAIHLTEADLDATDMAGNSALWWAARNGRFNTAQLLLDYKASVDQPNSMGATPLFMTAQHGEEGLLVLLLQHQANVNETTNSGATPLLVACQV